MSYSNNISYKTRALEAFVTKKFKQWMENRKSITPDMWYGKFSDRYHSGYPDFIACEMGGMVCYELKAQGKKLTKLQAHIARQLVRAGAKYYIVSWDGEALSLTDFMEYEGGKK